MKTYLSAFLLFLSSQLAYSQTLWLPGGTSAIGNNTTNGYVGIGTPTPASKLHVSNSNAYKRETFRVYQDGNTTNYLNLWQGTGGAAIDAIGTGLLIFGNDQPINVLIGNNDNVSKLGIGTSAPQTRLDLGELRLDQIPSFPAEGSIGEGIWGNYIIGGIGTSLHQQLRLGVSNDNYTRAEVFLDNGNRADGTISLKTVNGNGGALTRMFINGVGQVGIGTTSPGLATHIVGANGFPVTSGSQIGVLRLQGGANNSVLDFSVSNGVGASLQVTDPNLSTPYSLMLNPNGGGVCVGSTRVFAEKLQVDGTVGIGRMGTASGAGLKIEYTDNGGSGTTVFKNQRWGGDFYFKRMDSNGEKTQVYFGGFPNHHMDIYDNNNQVNTRLNTSGDSFFNGGNVGIGTGAAVLDAKLDVNGRVHAEEVKVDLNVPGPDYVFEKDYKLTSLQEIKNYIDQNKHLPEVPSAKEMEKNGVQLGEMNMLLLKKIEELTLYVIELKKENEILKQRMDNAEQKK